MPTLDDYPNGIPRDEFAAVECCLCGGATNTDDRAHTGYGWAHVTCQKEQQWNIR